MKYKVGQIVKIRTDLKPHTRYGSNVFVDKMKPLLGKRVTIECVYTNNEFKIVEDRHKLNWTEEMLVGIDNDDIKKIKEEFLK